MGPKIACFWRSDPPSALLIDRRGEAFARPGSTRRTHRVVRILDAGAEAVESNPVAAAALRGGDAFAGEQIAWPHLGDPEPPLCIEPLKGRRIEIGSADESRLTLRLDSALRLDQAVDGWCVVASVPPASADDRGLSASEAVRLTPPAWLAPRDFGGEGSGAPIRNVEAIAGLARRRLGVERLACTLWVTPVLGDRFGPMTVLDADERVAEALVVSIAPDAGLGRRAAVERVEFRIAGPEGVSTAALARLSGLVCRRQRFDRAQHRHAPLRWLGDDRRRAVLQLTPAMEHGDIVGVVSPDRSIRLRVEGGAPLSGDHDAGDYAALFVRREDRFAPASSDQRLRRFAGGLLALATPHPVSAAEDPGGFDARRAEIVAQLRRHVEATALGLEPALRDRAAAYVTHLLDDRQTPLHRAVVLGNDPAVLKAYVEADRRTLPPTLPSGRAGRPRRDQAV